MTDIELTPETKYDGGSWHVKGTYNEDIVAMVLYYYEVNDITPSKTNFRQAFEDPEYEQGDEEFRKILSGSDKGDTWSKKTGSVKIEENQLFIFPIIFQHHVEPFELMDKTKNDLSTKEVFPQKINWYNDEKIVEYLKIPKVIVKEL